MDAAFLSSPEFFLYGWGLTALAAGFLYVRSERHCRAHARTREQLESFQKESQQTLEETRRLESARAQFFAQVAHDLKTPLTLMMGPLSELANVSQNWPEEHRKKMGLALRNTKSLQHLIADLTDVAKLDARCLGLHCQEADLVKLTKECLAPFESVLEQRQVEFSLQAAAQVLAEVDVEKIRRIWMNLISNAVKMTPEGGRIRISLRREDEEIVFAIEDSGPGLNEVQRRQIFERYSPSNPLKTSTGSGLGLAVVKELTELHAGSVKVLPDQKFGTTFIVRLPRRSVTGVSTLSASAPSFSVWPALPDTPAPPAAPLMSPKADAPLILICEESAETAQFLGETLHSEFRVALSTNDAQGVARAQSLQPDLILTDLSSPTVDGNSLFSQLQADEHLRRTPLLILSAADDSTRVQMLKAGAEECLAKPFAPEELRVRVRRLIQRAKETAEMHHRLREQDLHLVEMREELASQKMDAQNAYEFARLAQQSASKAEKAKSAFLSLISHELNTPLAAISLGVQMLHKREWSELKERQRQIVDRLTHSSKQLSMLVQDLLEYVRTDEGESNRSEIDIGALVTETISMLQNAAQEKGLRLEATLPPSLSPVIADSTKVQAIFKNLLVNALKFTEKGRVQVTVTQDPQALQIMVMDTGIGIPPEDLERIFEPFQRVEAIETRSTFGLGLGLALVKQLVDSIGGVIRVESLIRQGTTFIVRLPRNPRTPLGMRSSE